MQQPSRHRGTAGRQLTVLLGPLLSSRLTPVSEEKNRPPGKGGHRTVKKATYLLEPLPPELLLPAPVVPPMPVPVVPAPA